MWLYLFVVKDGGELDFGAGEVYFPDESAGFFRAESRSMPQSSHSMESGPVYLA